MTEEHDKTRRWWQFSTRELLLLVLITGLIAGWWVDNRRASDERNRLQLAIIEWAAVAVTAVAAPRAHEEQQRILYRFERDHPELDSTPLKAAFMDN